MRITCQELLATFEGALERRGMASAAARACATLFVETTRDGVITHGVNRFPVFIRQIEQGDVLVNAEPVQVQAWGAMERWDGQAGPGNLNAARCMDRAVALAREHGICAVALRNTNHWMRGGTYGLRAAAAGCVGICWSNALASMPAWGGRDGRLGTNPLVLAVPGDPPTLVDVAMSQFSYGKLEQYRLRGERLPVPGGYDVSGALSVVPGAIEASRRPQPMGYWKGSALAAVLDMIAAALSGGNGTVDLSRTGRETALSQVFIAIGLEAGGAWEATVQRIKDDIRASVPDEAGNAPHIPGERVVALRAMHDRDGITIDDRVWARVKEL